ncbi:YfhO family protein [Luteibaculum oceani]|uniref:YfhO family protein n=1 Tax=Luteibaculum oceani TaxID=1294296 RepID=A0A5C6VEH9_9FLAO|nr:YfhO family protein [Luteibaculum oceani]TXC81538.1 YfhO family protein [Luteibaculum oceani]
MNNILPKLKGPLLAVAIFFGLTFAFFYPAFNGYKIKQGDIKNFMGMSHEVVHHRNTTGEQSLWTNSMFGGMPVFQISTVYADHALRFVDKALTLFIPNNSRLFFLYLISFYLMGLLLGWRNELSIIGAIGFAFSTYFIVILEAGHNSKAHAIGYMPLVFGAFHKLWKSDKKLLYGGLFALTLALEIWCNHVQITYYLGILLGFYSLFKVYGVVKDKSFPNFTKTVGFAAIATILAVAANFASLYNTYTYSKATTRGGSVLTIKPNGESNEDIVTSGLDRDYVVQWSYGLQESWTLLIPNAKGGATSAIGMDNKAVRKAPRALQQSIAQSNSYWGNQAFTSGPVYVGAIVVFLFLLACFWIQGRLKWVIIISTVLALALSWGKNFMGLTNFFLDFIPGYNKFRAVTIILALLEFTIPLLAFMGIEKMLRERFTWEDHKKTFYGVSGAVLGLLLLFWLIPDTFFSFLSETEKQNFLGASNGANAVQIQNYIDALKEVRISIFKSDVLRSLAFIVFAAFLVMAYLKGQIKKSYVFIIGLGVLILADLWPVNKRYLNTEKERGQYVNWEKKESAVVPAPPSAADNQILQAELRENPQLAQEINVAIQNARAEKPNLSQLEQEKIKFAILNLNSNYRVLNLARSTFNDSYTSFYHKSIGGYHGAKLRRYQDIIDFHYAGGLNFQVLNMLNTKYFIQNREGRLIAIPNNERFGNAWMVSNLIEVTSPNDAILALKEDASDLRNEVVVNVSDFPELKAYSPQLDSTASISLTSYLPNELTYSFNAQKEQLVVFSEIYYQPGWKAYIDGVEVDHFRANYILRAMKVPEGQHEIKFVFNPEMYSTGNKINLAASILILLLLGAGIYRDQKAN